ncbi:MAG: hypothetical protein AAGA77_11555 [Bacteroidota bacterium]
MHESFYLDFDNLNDGEKYLFAFQQRLAGFQLLDPDPVDILIFYTDGLTPSQTIL